MWVYDHALGAYYDADSQTYAIPSGQAGEDWTYVPAKDFASTSAAAAEEPVGWGALMEEGKLEAGAKVKHPAYGGSRSTDQPAPAPATAQVAPPLNEVLRLVVRQSKVLAPGSIAIIDTREDGVSLGRDRVPGGGRIRLREMEASKAHAVIFWDDGGWNIVDLGSTHGTYVDDRRLSDPKQASKPHRLKHSSIIKIASTTCIAHIHEDWPCDECKLAGANEILLDDSRTEVEAQVPEGNTYAMNSQERRDNREVKRKREMAALREALVGDAPRPKRPAVARKWEPPAPLTHSKMASAPAPAPAASQTFSETMMAKQGWGGGGLGKLGDGRASPVEVDMRGERKGLGAADARRDTGEDWKVRAKQRRYNEIRDA